MESQSEFQGHAELIFFSKILERTKRTEIHSKLNRKRRTNANHGPVGQSIWGQFGTSLS